MARFRLVFDPLTAFCCRWADDWVPLPDTAIAYLAFPEWPKKPLERLATTTKRPKRMRRAASYVRLSNNETVHPEFSRK
jgi:hypothetical protein